MKTFRFASCAVLTLFMCLCDVTDAVTTASFSTTRSKPTTWLPRSTTSERPMTTTSDLSDTDQLKLILDDIENSLDRIHVGGRGPKGSRGYPGPPAPMYNPAIAGLRQLKQELEREWMPYDQKLNRMKLTIQRLHNLRMMFESGNHPCKLEISL